ncbi:hypothetical protein SEMRO_229_G092850.1 [Seminavis robusta]|uniref:Uncharacterized protein n=1 Tax=Seminavis robusta TaxID=568900 RepID=A0A9N8DSY3_9STRA|nr:hypothetical protein SEMRO_229_G092850.1 [Seminavis robusta]|eukprot:Sro229_g092850.1 n/a (736) ;mRNA; f:1992-4320
MMLLDKHTKAILHFDIEANEDYSCHDLVTKVRPELYADVVQGVRNRFHYLKRLKKNEPLNYLDVYSEAKKLHRAIPQDFWDKLAEKKKELEAKKAEDDAYSPSKLDELFSKNSNTDLEEQEDESTPKPTVVDEEVPPTVESTPPTTTIRRSRRLTKNAAPTPTPTKPPLPASAPKSKDVFSPILSTPIKKTKKETMAAGPNGTPVKKGSAKKAPAPVNKQIFDSVEEAEEMVDHLVQIDFDYPESMGHHLHSLRIPDSLLTKTSLGTYVSDEAKILLEDLIDLTDYENYQGLLVLNGKGFLVTLPAVSKFLMNQYHDLLELEKVKCEKTKQQFEFWISAVVKDKSRWNQTILCLFPEGVTCTTDFVSPEPQAPTSDQPVKLMLRELGLRTETKQGGTVPQIFYPGYFKLRIINDRPKMASVVDEPVQTLSSAFEGMCKIRAGGNVAADLPEPMETTSSVAAPSPRPDVQASSATIGAGSPFAGVRGLLEAVPKKQADTPVPFLGASLFGIVSPPKPPSKAKSHPQVPKGKPKGAPKGAPKLPTMPVPNVDLNAWLEFKQKHPEMANSKPYTVGAAQAAAAGGGEGAQFYDAKETATPKTTYQPPIPSSTKKPFLHVNTATEGTPFVFNTMTAQQEIESNRKGNFKPTVDSKNSSNDRIDNRMAKSSLKRAATLAKRRKRAELAARMEEQKAQDEELLTATDSNDGTIKMVNRVEAEMAKEYNESVDILNGGHLYN